MTSSKELAWTRFKLTACLNLKKNQQQQPIIILNFNTLMLSSFYDLYMKKD